MADVHELQDHPSKDYIQIKVNVARPVADRMQRVTHPSPFLVEKHTGSAQPAGDRGTRDYGDHCNDTGALWVL